MVEFCPKCGSIMKVRKEPTMTYLVWDSCKYAKELERKEMKEKVKPGKKVDIVENTVHPLAVTPHRCSKCGFGKAMTISKGIWYSDEDEVIEYVCGKCGFHEKDPDQKIT